MWKRKNKETKGKKLKKIAFGRRTWRKYDWVYIWKTYIKVVFIEVEKEKHVNCYKLWWKGGKG